MTRFPSYLVLSMVGALSCRAQTCGTPAWSHVTDLGPGRRAGMAIAFDELRGRTVIYGGGCAGLECPPGPSDFKDTWEWDGQNWQFKTLQGPIPWRETQACFDAAGERVIVFGGYDDGPIPPATFFGDTWAWDGQVWSLVATSGPSPRNLYALAADTDRQVVVLFGGYKQYEEYQDTWEWTGTQWLPRATTGPVKRTGHAMAYDKLRQRTVLFGGIGPAGYLDDTWEWDGSAWAQVASDGPSARRWHSMAFDPSRGVVVLYGGFEDQSTTTIGDLWQWDGSAWTQIGVSGPPPCMPSMAFDSWRGRLVLYGGFYLSCCSFETFKDTWEFAWPIAPSVYQNPLPLSVATGAPAQFSAASLGAPPLSWQWRHDGAPLVNGGGVSGATTNHLTIGAASSANAGEYDVAITNACGSTVSAPAALAVACYPDCDADGQLAVGDFGCFQTRFVAGDPWADCNNDDALTVADFGCFQTEFVTGCK